MSNTYVNTLLNPHLKDYQYGQPLCLLLTDNDSCINEELVVKTLVLYLLKLYLLFKLLSLACLVFKSVVLCCSGGHRLSCPVLTVAYSVCWMEITSRNRVEGMAVNTFLPFKIETVLGKRACQK